MASSRLPNALLSSPEYRSVSTLRCFDPKSQTACFERSPDHSTARAAPPMEYDFRGRSCYGSYGAPPASGGAPGSSLYRASGSPPTAPPHLRGPRPPQPPPPRPRLPPPRRPPYRATPGDPVVDKYIATGLGREAVSFAVLNYGDNPAKVKEFVKSYNALHEMGFTSPNVPELLAIHGNDPDEVIQHLLSTS